MSKIIIPAWPAERGLDKYARYTCIDFDRELSHGKTWIDIGCRTGIALNATRQKYQAHLIGVNAHPIKVLPGIEAIQAVIPHDRSLYSNYQGSADLLTDIYGAVSYENDPLAAMIYEALLLKQGGKAVIITLEAKLGNRKNQHDMVCFFETVMGQKLSFKRYRHYSDNTKRVISSLRITIQGNYTSKSSLDTLLTKAQKAIGLPNMEKVIYTPPDDSVNMWKIVYKPCKG
jgi:hypothetical protein